MSEVPQVSAEQLIEIYMNEGRDGLVRIFCVFEDKPPLNAIMEEIVDCNESLLKGDMQVSKYTTEMARLNDKFFNTLSDLALDSFGDGDLDSDSLKVFLDDLNGKKAKCDEFEKKDA